jgi:hypothetical protein
VFPVLKLNRILDQPQIRFIYNRGALQGVIDALAASNCELRGEVRRTPAA